MSPQILITDDDNDILSALSLLLKSEGYSVNTANSPEQAIEKFRAHNFDLIILDLNYARDTTSGEEGIQLIAALRQLDETIPIVVMTGWGTIEVAVSTMKNGANDFIQKPWENDRLLAIIANQLKLAKSHRQFAKLSQENQLLQAEFYSHNVIAESSAMQQIIGTLKHLAQSDVSVLLTGENGTGKSLFARLIHDNSPRSKHSMVSVNMGAVTESLFESEMFGHVKGAFTDAKTTRIGRFELADEGTLFLDEIANTPISQQAKLLRVLEDRQFEKVGSSKTQHVDIRLIAATNADLQQAVNAGQFRKDLLYRVNTMTIEIPPLRQRSADILPLANNFLTQIANKHNKPQLTIALDARQALQNYAWPGNVRELGHVMERASILCQTNEIGRNDLRLDIEGEFTATPTAKLASVSQQPQDTSADLRSLNEIEKDIIINRLDYYKGNAIEAAKSLGVSRSAFYRKLDKIKSET
ncbi:sigma-54-dependent transcriptional regulator [Aliikangiella maris]|uniref:Sigma-54 dependent transcriptional regulator n=2 Tax=Aliikangiella maris TaxID=3162458 RepID=A0ABV3MPQ1_9GAMM